MIHRLILVGAFLTGLLLAAFVEWHPASAQVVDGPDCVQFLSESEPEDGTFVPAGMTITKSWTLRNCGESTWEGYIAVRTEGLMHPGPRTIDVPTTLPGETAKVTLEFPVPDREGLADYHLRYEIAYPYVDGRRMVRIGQQFWMKINATDEAFE